MLSYFLDTGKSREETVLISWQESYQIGNAAIDLQHKKLFYLVDELDNAADAAALKQSFATLFKFTNEHFKTEEELMSNANYPELNEHKKKHEELLGQLGIVAAQPLSEEERLSTFRTFMTRWLVDHIEKEDRKLNAYLGQ